MRPDTADYAALFIYDVSLMDMRAPVEFNKGAFPHSTSLPLMTDSERQRVGTCYKQYGQQAAIELGHQLVSGAVKEQRLQAWAEFARKHPEGYLYCFRGGLRSQIVQGWLKEAGIDYPRVIGGYKAMRNFLIEQLDQAVAQCSFVVVGGLTGTGKTEVIAQLPNSIDLEGHANHRGSSFGKHATAQPAQINFENALAIDLLKRRARGQQHFVLEDESRLIGQCSLPLNLHQGMLNYPLVWLEDSLESRCTRILKDYVIDLSAEFISLHGEAGFELFAQRLLNSLDNIHKRLGGERHARLRQIMLEALLIQQKNGQVERHLQWIAALLNEYYDPMYAFQRESKGQRIVFSGNHAQVLEYLSQQPQVQG